jgi:hypothetical protein
MILNPAIELPQKGTRSTKQGGQVTEIILQGSRLLDGWMDSLPGKVF